MNKSVILILCTLFTIIVMISSCSNKLDQPNFPGLRCDLNGTEYVADTAYYEVNSGITIYGYTGSNQRFKFFLLRDNKDTTGNFSLDTSGVGNVAYYTDAGGTLYQSISGSVSISKFYNDSLSQIVNATFSFTGRVPGASGNTVDIQYGYMNNIPRR